MASKKKSKKKETSRNTYLAILVLLILLVGMWFIRQRRDVSQQATQRTEEVAQLRGVDNNPSNGFATKYLGTENIELNVTVFIRNGRQGVSYGVWVEGAEGEPVFLGEMALAGDVYTLNYGGEKLTREQNTVIVAELEDEETMGEVLLSGTLEE